MMIRMRIFTSAALKETGDAEGAELFSLERAILFRQDS